MAAWQHAQRFPDDTLGLSQSLGLVREYNPGEHIAESSMYAIRLWAVFGYSEGLA